MPRTEAEWEQIAEEHREQRRQETVQCPYCGTSGVWTYGGLDPAWLGNGHAKLTEFSESIRWDGINELGRDHTPKRCIEVLQKKRDEITDTLDKVITLALQTHRG